MKFKILLLLILLVTSYLLLVTPCYSIGDFAISYENNYEVKESGITLVDQTIRLRNLTTNYYASEYTLVLIGQQINKISAYDNLGPLKLETKKESNQVKIHVFFNEKVAGLDKILKWRLNYETTSLAHKNGLIWEIILPGLPNQEKIENYYVSLKTPESFGQPLFVWPKPLKDLTWSQNEIQKGGIILTFGQYQIFDFQIVYQINNSKNTKAVTEIALPPDTSYQRINFSQLNPLPLNTIIDNDGNYLAKYELPAKKNLKVTVAGFAKIFFTPQFKEILSTKEFNTYLSNQRYWEINSQEIKNLAQQLKTPEAIYEYVIKNLNYNYQKTKLKNPERLGALQIVKDKNQAICLEFSDLFIALCRAAGIPARLINGYAYTTNPKLSPLSGLFDILHAWPEYYNLKKQNWIMVDPTWSNTTNGIDYFNKLDLNHFVFVKKGKSSIYPYAPGGEVNSKNGQKNIHISFSNQDKIIQNGIVKIKFDLPNKTNLLLPIMGKIIIKNSGPGLLQVNNLNLLIEPLSISNSYNLGQIPPYGSKEISLNFSLFPYLLSKKLLSLQTKTLNLRIQADNLDNSFEIKLESIFIYLIYGGICVFFFIGILIARKTWGLYFQKSKK